MTQVIADEYSKIDKELLEMIEDVLLNRCENSTERMLEYAGTLDPKCKPTDVKKKGQAPGAKAAGGKEKSWRDLPVEQRLTHALVKGIDEFAVRVHLLCLICLPVDQSLTSTFAPPTVLCDCICALLDRVHGVLDSVRILLLAESSCRATRRHIILITHEGCI